jgi:hypothetical protein
MATIPTYFNDFLNEIRLTDTQLEDCKTGHKILRERLLSDNDLAPIIVDIFLQGSYRRATAVRPSKESELMDVDVVVVTTLNRHTKTPQEALNMFESFLKKYYKGKYKLQGRSWGIELSYVALDLVPTSAPSESQKIVIKSTPVTNNKSLSDALDWELKPSWLPIDERLVTSSAFIAKLAEEKEWQKEPLWIPDREARKWDETDPLSQIDATVKKNRLCNGHFVNVVKCLKWWRATQEPIPKHPKSYPLEHLTWVNCLDSTASVAEGVVGTFEHIRDNYKPQASARQTPFLPDHGVPSHNVLGRVSGEDWASFHRIVTTAADLARKAFDEPDVRKSAILWKQLFGDKFPDPPPDSDEHSEGDDPQKGGYTPRKDVSIIGGGRFA